MSLQIHLYLSKFHENTSFLSAHNSRELVRMLQEIDLVECMCIYGERERN